jgi:hypothetical protein
VMVDAVFNQIEIWAKMTLARKIWSIQARSRTATAHGCLSDEGGKTPEREVEAAAPGNVIYDIVTVNLRISHNQLRSQISADIPK